MTEIQILNLLQRVSVANHTNALYQQVFLRLLKAFAVSHNLSISDLTVAQILVVYEQADEAYNTQIS